MPIDQDFPKNHQLIGKHKHADGEHFHFIWGKDKPNFHTSSHHVMIGTVLVILFVSSFSTINNSILPIKAVTAEVENNEDEETAYLKFASQAVKQSDNSRTVNATIQLPEAAKGPPIPAKGYLVQQIGGGLYWLTDGAYQTMFMVTDKGVVAVDAPATIGNNYLKDYSRSDNQASYICNLQPCSYRSYRCSRDIPEECYYYSSTRSCN